MRESPPPFSLSAFAARSGCKSLKVNFRCRPPLPSRITTPRTRNFSSLIRTGISRRQMMSSTVTGPRSSALKTNSSIVMSAPCFAASSSGIIRMARGVSRLPNFTLKSPRPAPLTGLFPVCSFRRNGRYLRIPAGWNRRKATVADRDRERRKWAGKPVRENAIPPFWRDHAARHTGKRGLTNVCCKRRSVKSAMASAPVTETPNVGAMTAYYAINWTIGADGISLGPRKWRD